MAGCAPVAISAAVEGDVDAAVLGRLVVRAGGRLDRLCLRGAVRQVEAWLLADRERVAAFLRVACSRVPERPEELESPKTAMVNLARRSRSPAVTADMVPREGSGRSAGPAYSSRLIEFVTCSERGWRPEVAAESADSLQRAMVRINRIVTGSGIG